MLEIIWGLKVAAIFDVWTIEHLLSGISVGCAVKKRNHKELAKILKSKEHQCHYWYFNLVGVLFLAYAWESIEHYMEIGTMGDAVKFWMQGVEFWPNRLITDPLMLVIGYFLAKKFPVTVWPARVLSFLWLFVHVFIFPHSMYLHELL